MEKILILTVGFNGGGSGKMAMIMENFLNKSYKTTTLVFNEDKGIFHLKGKKINFSLFKSCFPGRGYIEIIPNIIKTLKYIKKEKPDIVIGVGTYSNLLGLIAKKFFNFKLLLSQHEHITTRKASTPHLSIYNIIFPIIKKLIGNNKIICVSNDVKVDTIKFYGIKESQAQTIYNGLDFDEIKKLGNEEININDKYIINIGRLDTGKNQELLIKAFSKSKAKKDYKILLLGEGEKKEYLKELCKNLNIESSVIFAGFNKNPYKFLKKASLFCFTSKTEALPTVLIESLILNIPIITVPVIGAKEIIDNGNFGIITKDWEELSIVKELDNFVDQGITTKNKEQQQFLQNNFSIESMEKAYLKAINDLI